jgi:curli biogenesis system outer membrane secretion channel CsgG
MDFQATSIETQTGSGMVFGEQDFNHQVGVSISVFDTRTQEVLYTQRIELQEIGEASDDDFEESNGGFVITRTRENLLKNRW